MRFSRVPLLGLVLAMGCDQTQTSPLAPIDTDLAFDRHEIDHIDSRSGEFELRGLNTPNLPAPHFTETLSLNTHLIGPGGSVKIKLVLHVVLTRKGITRIVVDSRKGPCAPT